MINRADVSALLAGQHFVAHLEQLRSLGVSPSTIYRWRRSGAITIVLPGVVALAGAPRTFELEAMAGQLHAGDSGYLCGFTAARIHGLRGFPARPVMVNYVCFEHRRAQLPTWLQRSYSNWRSDDDVMVIDGFRVERPLPMLFTLAARCTDHRFERAAEDAWHRGLITPESAHGYVTQFRRSGRTGVSRLVRWLDKTTARTHPMQSHLEVDLLDTIRRAGLPEPQKQHRLRLANGEDIHLDLAWPERRLAVEPGHSWFHGGDLQMRRDAARDRACAQLGWLVLRYDETAKRELADVGREIASVFRQRPVIHPSAC